MVWAVRVEGEGSLLEGAVRQVRLDEPKSSIGRRRVEGTDVGGSEEAVLFDVGGQGGIRKTDVGVWAMVVMPEAAAAVINPVAASPASPPPPTSYPPPPRALSTPSYPQQA